MGGVGVSIYLFIFSQRFVPPLTFSWKFPRDELEGWIFFYDRKTLLLFAFLFPAGRIFSFSVDFLYFPRNCEIAVSAIAIASLVVIVSGLGLDGNTKHTAGESKLTLRDHKRFERPSLVDNDQDCPPRSDESDGHTMTYNTWAYRCSTERLRVFSIHAIIYSFTKKRR